MADIKSITLKLFSYAELDRIVTVLVGTTVLPIIVHLIPVPYGVPLGAMWLPVFYAPFLAVIYCRFHVPLTVAVLAPVINVLFTGRPLQPVAVMLAIELVIFSSIAKVLYMKYRRFIFISLISYILTKFISSIVMGIKPYFIEGPSRLSYFLGSLEVATPGLIMLLLINIFAVSKKHD